MMFRPRASAALATTILAAVAFGAASPAGAEPRTRVATVHPVLETPSLSAPGDADDPAIWIHPVDRSKSLVVATAKDAGLKVYDLVGREVQSFAAVQQADGHGRYNNVDVAYGFRLASGEKVDIAVASDRGLDRLRVWRIDPAAKQPLVDITAGVTPRVFPTRQGKGAEEDNPVKDQLTAYGLTLWKDGERVFAVVTQRAAPRIALMELVAAADGGVSAKPVRVWDFPASWRGQDLREKVKGDPAREWNPQFEGMAVDRDTGILYAAQENVGVWRINLESGEAEASPFVETRGEPTSPFNNPKGRISRDAEGVSIWYGPHGAGYILVSSQGKAHGDKKHRDPAGLHDTFAVFDRGPGNRYLGSFRIAGKKGIDGDQECDGADITSVILPGYPEGLLVVQDGYDDDLNGMSGEPKRTNFKYVSWADVAKALKLPELPAGSVDPRR